MNLIPSPVKRSAIPWSDARLKSLAKTGTSLTLKLSIINTELETPSFFIELKIRYPSSNPFMKSYLLIKGFGWFEINFVIVSF